MDSVESALAAEYQVPMGLLGTTLGRNLRKIRKRLGLTQIDVQQKAGVKQTTYSGWERGASFSQLDEAVRKMGGDPAELLTSVVPSEDPKIAEFVELFVQLNDADKYKTIGFMSAKVTPKLRSAGGIE